MPGIENMSVKRKTLSLLLAVVLALSCLLVLLPTPVYAAARTASVTGNWDNTATWGGSAVPTSADDVTINAGVTVTVNVPNAQCLTLTLNEGTNGNATLTFNNGSQLTIGTSLTLGANNKNRTGNIDMTSGGTLQIGTTVTFNYGTWTPGTGTVEYNGAASDR